MSREVGSPADQDPSEAVDYDLLIVGGSASAVSVAASMVEAGLSRVRLIVAPDEAVAFSMVASKHNTEIGYGETLLRIDTDQDRVLLWTDHRVYRARGVVIALTEPDPEWKPVITPPDSDKISIDVLPEVLRDRDVLIIGDSDHAAELLTEASASGARVVLAAGGMDPAQLAPASSAHLRRLEHDRLATVLYRSVPNDIWAAKEFPIAIFNDRRTPDLEFDHIVFASRRRPAPLDKLTITDRAMTSGKVWFDGADVSGAGESWQLASHLGANCFPEIALPKAPLTWQRRVNHVSAIEELRDEHYNATITAFEKRHSDLWVLRVRPDRGNTAHLPGQYASLGLGYWEDRNDQFSDEGIDDKWHKLIRRSYSISHSMFDSSGYLAKPDTEELEFYIVLVPADDGHVSALTPRLASKEVGERIYLGPKVAGRYTLAPVESPETAVVFFATGTGEAPHNSMVVELLRKGHTGPIVSTVTVRRWQDLGYLDAHRKLEQRFPNYHYLPMPTREPDVPKQYLQDLVRNGEIELALGAVFNPSNTHVFLCGNPAMIGLPEETDGELRFPETTGVIELLTARGFTISHRNQPGNIHFEEYW